MSNEIKCDHCGGSIEIRQLIKTKNKYVCPRCLSTIKDKMAVDNFKKKLESKIKSGVI